MKRQLIHAAAATVLGLGLTTGIAAAQTGPSISGTKDSVNIVKGHTFTMTHVYTYNNVSAGTTNSQTALSGNSIVKHNLSGGNASTGLASNGNTMTTNVGLNNSPTTTAALSSASTSGPSISNTSNDSVNVIKTGSATMTHVATINDLNVVNSNTQAAESGNAVVKFNMYGGSATTGAATNTNSSNVTVNVTN